VQAVGKNHKHDHQGGTPMEPKRQSVKQPNENANAASKAPAGRKQSGNEASTASKQQSAASNPGATSNPSPASNPGATSNQGAANQGRSGNQGGNPQGGGEQDLLQHAKQAGGNIMNQVQQQAGSQLTRGKESAANDLTHVVNAVRQFGQNLAAEQGGPIARYAAEYGDKAAQSLERLSTYIREQDPKQLLSDVQNFGRRRPALLLGGAFLLGFAGARLIKTSINAASEHAPSQHLQSQQSFQPNAPAATPSTSTMTNAM
jgi:hypothetical protein